MPLNNYSVEDFLNVLVSAWQGTVKAFRTFLTDSSGNEVTVTDNALVTMSRLMSSVHNGNHYFVKGYITLGNGEDIDFAVTVPAGNTDIHMRFKVVGNDGPMTMVVKEGATIDAAGSAVVARNNNRNSTNTSALTIQTDPTYTDEGTEIGSTYSGALKQAGLVENDEGIILKAGYTYIFRMVNELANNNNIDYLGVWHE